MVRERVAASAIAALVICVSMGALGGCTATSLGTGTAAVTASTALSDARQFTREWYETSEALSPKPAVTKRTQTILADPGGIDHLGTANVVVLSSNVESIASVDSTADGVTRLRSQGAEVELTLQGAANANGVIVDGHLVYANAAPGGGHRIVRAAADRIEDFVTVDAQGPKELVYKIALKSGIAGLRVVADTVELLDQGGAPRLRMRRPLIVDSFHKQVAGTVAIAGCTVDQDPRGPWDRAVTPPGSSSCDIHVSWPSSVSFPILVDPDWSSTGNMILPRLDHTLTALDDGRILATGGSNDSMGPPFFETELFDPSTRTWAMTGLLNVARTGHQAVRQLDGKVMAIAGMGPSLVAIASVEIYDPTSGTWTTTGSLSTPRRLFAAAFTISGNNPVVVVAGGYNDSVTPAQFLSSAEVFTGGGSTWSSAGTMSTGRASLAMSRLSDSRLLATGGTDGTIDFASTEAYTPGGSWASAGNMGTARQRHTQASLSNDTAVIAGGYTSGASVPTQTTEVYRTSTNTWQSGPTMSSPRVFHTATPLGGLLLLGGGEGDVGQLLSSVDRYDSSTNTITADSPLTRGRAKHATTDTWGGAWLVLAAGGEDLTGGPAINTTDAHSRNVVSAGQTAPPIDIGWTNTNLKGNLSSASTVSAFVKNTGTISRTVNVTLRGFGLDHREATRAIATYNIPASTTQNFSFLVGDIPMQSIGIETELQLEADWVGGGGITARVVTPPLFVKFASGYGTATFTGWEGDDDQVPTNPAWTSFSQVLDSIRSSALSVFTATGRYWNGHKFINYTSSGTKRPSYLFRGPRKKKFDELRGLPGNQPPENNPPPNSFQICTTWKAQYLDGGYGESYFNTNAPVDIPARYARFLVAGSNPGDPIIYDSYLYAGGCTGYMNMPDGNY